MTKSIYQSRRTSSGHAPPQLRPDQWPDRAMEQVPGHEHHRRPDGGADGEHAKTGKVGLRPVTGSFPTRSLSFALGMVPYVRGRSEMVTRQRRPIGV